jgi:transposase InsO family protein
VNPKRVYRLLREDKLLCVRKRKFVVTTNSNHGRKVYSNLAASMVLTGVDQLWRADITYIRLREEFVFLAVILDAFSRRVIGWVLDRNMEDELTLTALRMALSRRSIQPFDRQKSLPHSSMIAWPVPGDTLHLVVLVAMNRRIA